MKILTYTVVLAILSFFTVSCSDESNDDVTNDVTDSGYTQDNETTKDPVRCEDGKETYQIEYFKTEAGRVNTKNEIESGIEYCPDGSWHRYKSVECIPYALVDDYLCEPDANSSVCKTNSDCGKKPNGKCVSDSNVICKCRYECITDNDCSATEACFCSAVKKVSLGAELFGIGAYNECVPANCRTDDDCDGYRCGVSEMNGAIGSVSDNGIRMGLYCHTKDDKCSGDSDCGDTAPDVCVYNIKSGYWVCSERGED